MKKAIITVVAAIIIAAVALFLAVTLLTPKAEGDLTGIMDPTEPSVPVEDTPAVSIEPVETGPIKTYDNGVATITYDSTVIYFDEIPSDNTDGLPLTSFLLMASEEALPRVDVFPLTLDMPFASETTNEEWETLARTLISSYYSSDMKSLVSISFSNSAVKIDGVTAKMYTVFDCDVDGYSSNNMNGIVRLVADASHAIITVALCTEGGSIPAEMNDLYMSVELN